MAFKGLFSKLRFIANPAIQILWVPLLYMILGNLGLILTLWESGDRTLDEQEKLPNGPETFDFIVVGAGSAGSVVAYRLSQYYSVLLLEAGGEPNPLQLIPGFGLFLINYPQTDWMHRSLPQQFSTLGSKDQESSWSAGKTLGGTGTLNLMIHLRGHTMDFDNWARITGDPSWSWEGVLPYFKSFENHDGGDPRYHGFNGPLRIEVADYVGLGTEFVKAGQEFGYPETDLNAPFSEGFDILRFPIKNGIRQSPYEAFIKPMRRRKNATIRKYSHVTRILFKEGNAAYGVEYERHGEKRTAFARKEVIVSAGTITTPRILMLSGIGPAEHLQEIGIPVRQNLPVGKHLQDHTAAFMGPFFIDKPRTVYLDRDLSPGAFVQWFTGGRGILSSPGAPAAGIISSSYAKSRGQANWPDLVLYYFGFSAFKTYGQVLSHAFNLKVDEMVKYYKHAVGKESFTVGVSGARPFSKGYIKLGGPSPYDKVIIDPNYFSDPGDVDLKAMVEGMKFTVRMIENSTELGQKLGGRFTSECLPGCEHVPFRSDAYWECYARRFTITLHHPVGTCGMGRVVDTQLRVYGTQRLRVIDSSIQPEIVVTNTQASALMIGEKGADIVLKYWKRADQQGKSPQQGYAYSHNVNQVVNAPKNLTISITANQDYVDGTGQPGRTMASLNPYYLYNTN